MIELDLRVLRSFIEIARSKSFTKAAARLNLSQPRLSVRMREFEASLGFAVFRRDARTVELTPEGAKLFDPIARCVAQADKTEAALHDAGAEFRQRLQIGASPLFSVERWQIMERFAVAHPEARPRIMIAPSPEIFAALRDGALDLGFTASQGAGDLERLTLWKSAYGLILKADSPLAAHSVIEPATLKGLMIETFPREAIAGLHADVTGLLRPFGVALVDMIEGCSEAIAHRVLRGDGIVLSPRWWRSPENAPTGIVHRMVRGIDETLDFDLVRSKKLQSPAARRLWAMLSAEAATH
ncbi:LysR family transcriptional regulator [Sphingomonas immobilis]|uniref:LysR family transcriptional regulator n=1 Tax=Sphingomonas immobilis TaxID=3063997 RepID=A0ABT9A261_9SPHN|nr:LysR family transcriptional regulator [Sphingomonas sp. CA1-15]MDO7843927.1 LysR family transcriptional regulator [Sphingomonas sp. CA1-15]